MSDFLHRIALSLLTALFLSACGQTASQKQQPNEIDFFEPPQWNRWVRIDENTRIPTGPHSADAFDWAPDDRPIFFHTAEESERRRDEWEPFFEGGRYGNLSDKIAWQFKIVARYAPVLPRRDFDRNFAQLPDGWWRNRGSFIGIGYPVSDTYLHMFECGGFDGEAVYIMDDLLVKCFNTITIEIFVIADPDAPPAPRMSPTDPGRGTPERLPSRWVEWFLDIREGPETPNNPLPPEEPNLDRLDVYGYFASETIGVATERYVKPRYMRAGGVGNYIWSIWPHKIPREHCTDAGLESTVCMPNNL
jgi:hypothetical protein